jgi:glyoxylase-like metal-dependent hydrolase (beta-lactamase superfamily II)
MRKQKGIDMKNLLTAFVSLTVPLISFAAPGWSVTPIQDRPMTMPGTLFRSVDPQERFRPADAYPASLNVFLIRDESGGRCALIDAGYGRADSRLLPELARLGVKPEDISAVFITHIHPDHVGGLTTPDGTTAFPAAKVCIARKEYEAWRRDPARAGLARHLEPVGKNLVLLDYDAPVAPYGLVPLCFPGHTQGHTVFRMRLETGQGAENIHFVGDIVHAAELQIPRPEFCARFDMDMDTAVKSRRELLNGAAVWYGAHLPFPGIVRIERK